MARHLRPAMVLSRAAHCLLSCSTFFVDVVMREWIWQLWQGGKYEEVELLELI
jgi:hypothetical protein